MSIPVLSIVDFDSQDTEKVICYLREFGVQTTVIAAPLRWVGLLPAVLGPGPAGTPLMLLKRYVSRGL